MRKEKLEKAVARYKKGDDNSFAFIYDNTYKVIFFTIYEVLGDKSLSEDIMQDVYLKACQNINNYKNDNFLAWLSKIAKNLAINEYNKRKHVDLVDIQDYDGRFYTQGDENFELIDTARKILDEESFQILSMCAIYSYKRREVSSILNLPISTVSYKYNSALDKLKKYLKENELL